MECKWLQQVLFVLCLSVRAECSDFEPNDTWDASYPIAGARVVTDRLEHASSGPDTLLGLLDQDGNLTRVDDDGSFFGNGLASAFLSVPIPDTEELRMRVTGAFDYDFDGLLDDDLLLHPEQGDFEAYATIYDETGNVVHSEGYARRLEPGGVVDFSLSVDPAWSGGSFDFEINNFGEEASDVDFWEFHSLPLGMPYVAEVTSAEFDSVLGWYDGVGRSILQDDDSGVGFLSRISGVIPASGSLYLAVSAYPDTGFSGVHSADGSYSLELVLVPEPSALLIALLAFTTALARRPRCR